MATEVSSDRWTREHRLSAELLSFEEDSNLPAWPASVIEDTAEDDPHVELTLALTDEIEGVRAFQNELAEVVALVAENLSSVVVGQKALAAKLDALRPVAEPDPDPLLSIDNVLNGLVLIVNKIDKLQRAMDKQRVGGAIIQYDGNGYPAKITRSDGSELRIVRDLNRRQVRLERAAT